jgi:predicted MFS family arabinose efflux permease
LALMLPVPLGDRVERRRLMAVQLLALVAVLAIVSLARSTSVLLAGMLAVGLLGTAMTQGLTAYAASAAAPHARGRSVSSVWSVWPVHWPLSLLQQSLWVLVIGIVLLDLGGRALHVTNQSMIFRAKPASHSRLVGLYMFFYAVGSGLGALARRPPLPMQGGLGYASRAQRSACRR